MRKKGNTVLAGLIICLLLVFLAAAGKLFGAYLKYQKGDVSYEKLQEYVQEPEEEESPKSEKEKEEPKNRYLEIDFAGLKAVNPDVIAWIQIPALDISYPVVHRCGSRGNRPGGDTFHLCQLQTGLSVYCPWETDRGNSKLKKKI